ncbi:hypothetical protein FA15DRAFT_635667 [Coprinopsis marcescibilis]|uniref:MFS general substrate transporter n=1 Tax=Coprinopsis marcescibilis TaxID=230819 RepID=A0A5C3L4H8_COPMA|nr:hypothetical protein FA15DRAFT_635667 [Coprinopsis marcescibilis]
MQPVTPTLEQSSEEDTLLPGPRHRHQQARSKGMQSFLSSYFGWKASPYWLIPIVVSMSLSRGITMAPRIQVYRAIACRSILKESGSLGFDLAALVLSPECVDREVEARGAKLQAFVITFMSVLSAMSTGFWSRLGDTHGRKPIFATFFVGAGLMELVFVLVMKSDTLFSRHGERFILVGPLIEGLVGGLSVFNGVVHAYASDCTRHGSRSKIFSTIQGMVFVGLAMGPWASLSTLASRLLNHFAGHFLPKTGYSDLHFFCSIGVIFFNLIFVLFVCPESLQKAQPDDDGQTEFKISAALIREKATAFVTSIALPISMFAPRRIHGTQKRTYMVTLVGMALFLYLVSTGVFSVKYFYARQVFEWTTAELGYYMSTLWITRAFNLLVFLPIVISYLKPKPTSLDKNAPNSHDIAAELRFDRYLAQISLGADGLADALVAITMSRSRPIFIALSCLTSMTSGGNPSLHSLGAVCMHASGYSNEVGALFGAMAVLSAIAHIISPGLYALTYSKSVGSFPEAIFVLAACLLLSATFLLSRVRPVESDIALVHTPSRSSRVSFEYQAVAITEGVESEEDEEEIESRRGKARRHSQVA